MRELLTHLLGSPAIGGMAFAGIHVRMAVLTSALYLLVAGSRSRSADLRGDTMHATAVSGS
jgi:hypothetical protein